MGGVGAGHKSWRARESRHVNIQKARAARKRAPLPWRSGMESRIIEQLVWQWFLEARGWKLAVGEKQKRQQQVPHHHPAHAAGWVRDDNVKSSGERSTVPGVRVERDSESRPPRRAGAGWVNPAPTRVKGRPARADRPFGSAQDKPWAKLRVARFLGVSHTWVNKLVKRFEADPERMRRKMAAFAPASIEKLEQAREETRRQRERGWLRGPIRYRRVKVVIQGKKTRVVAATRAEGPRRQAEVESERAALRQAPFGIARRCGQAQDKPFDYAQGQPYRLSGEDVRRDFVKAPLGGQATARQASGVNNEQQMRQGEVLHCARHGGQAQDLMERDSASDPPRRAGAGRVNHAPTKMGEMPVAYREIPSWAKGLLLPGDPGKTSGRDVSAFAKNRSGATGMPPFGKSSQDRQGKRPVPFAFRRRR